MLPSKSVTRDPKILLIDPAENDINTCDRWAFAVSDAPAKKADTAKVLYSAELAFALTVESTCPPAPQAIHCVEKTWTHEAHKAKHDDLSCGMGVESPEAFGALEDLCTH